MSMVFDDALYHRVVRFVKWFLRKRRISDAYVVDEITQLTVIQVEKYIKTFDRSKGSFENWLQTVTSNQMKMYLNKAEKEQRREFWDEGIKYVPMEGTEEEEEVWDYYLHAVFKTEIPPKILPKFIAVSRMIFEGNQVEYSCQKIGMSHVTFYKYAKKVKVIYSECKKEDEQLLAR